MQAPQVTRIVARTRRTGRRRRDAEVGRPPSVRSDRGQPAPPELRRHDQRDDAHGRRGAQRDGQRSPLSPDAEPERAHARGDLGEQHERPCPWMSKPEHDGGGHQKMDVPVVDLEGHGWQRQDRYRPASAHPQRGSQRDQHPKPQEEPPWQHGEDAEQQTDRWRIAKRAQRRQAAFGQRIPQAQILEPVRVSVIAEAPPDGWDDDHDPGGDEPPGDQRAVAHGAPAQRARLGRQPHPRRRARPWPDSRPSPPVIGRASSFCPVAGRTMLLPGARRRLARLWR